MTNKQTQQINTFVPLDASMQDVPQYLRHLEYNAKENDPDGEKVYALLRMIAELNLNPEESPPFETYTFSWREIDNAGWDILRSALDELHHTGMQARIADLLSDHVPKADAYPYRLKAIDLYLADAKAREDTVLTLRHDEGIVPLRRAVTIARQLGPKNQKYSEIYDQLVEDLARISPSDNEGWYTFYVMQILRKAKYGDFAAFAQQAEDTAHRLVANSRYLMARRLWETAAGWYRLLGDQAGRMQALINGAEALVLEAQHPAFPDAGPHYRANDYKTAVLALIAANAPAQRINDVQLEMRKFQQQTPADATTVTMTISDQLLQNMQQDGADQVRGKNLQDAILAVAAMPSMPSESQLSADAKAVLEGVPVSRLFSLQVVDSEGRSQPSPTTEGEEIDFQVYEIQQYRRMLIAVPILAAVKQIQSEHAVTLEDLKLITDQHPHLPPEYSSGVLKGLLAGFQCDFGTAVDRLIPRIETLLRNALTNAGTVTSTIKDPQFQKELDLNNFLKAPMVTTLEKIYPANMLFDLRGLLVEAMGENLRNKVAHGMAADPDIEGKLGVYLWALALRLFTHHLQPTPDQALDNT